MKLRWPGILFSPFIIALIMAVALLYLLPDYFPEYSATVISTNDSGGRDNLISCEDLDGDCVTEWIYLKYNRIGNGAFTIRDHQSRTIRQYNLPGQFVIYNSSYITGDIDNDSLKEIYTYYLRNDSIFLGYCEPFADLNLDVESTFIDTLVPGTSVDDIDFKFFKITDLDKDGFQDILFSVGARFSLQPRRVYMYTPLTGRYRRSPIGYSIISLQWITDLDGDGNNEILTSVGSNGNVPARKGYPYHDSSAWLIVFDQDLDYKFPPVEFPGTQTSVVSYPVKGTHNTIGTFVKRLNYDANQPGEFIIFDDQLKLVNAIDIDSLFGGFNRDVRALFFNYQIYLLARSNDEIYTLKRGLELEKLPGRYQLGQQIRAHDLDNDGTDELICFGKDKITIYREGFRHPVRFFKPLFFDPPYDQITTFEASKGLVKTFIQFGASYFILEYGKNPGYWLRFLYCLGIFLGLLALVMLIRLMYKYQLDQRQKISDQITDLQLKTIRSQFDPHFTFNVINAISYMVNKADLENANSYIHKFSGFLRSQVTGADKIERLLSDELESIDNYLAIEKMRFKDLFEYSITTAPDISEFATVPKNLLMIFVENAIKHGIRPLNGNGRIDIILLKRKDILEIIIEDNGVGRNYQGDKAPGTGKGLELVNQILDLYYKLTHKRIIYWFVDKTPPDRGTRVVISIP